MIRPRYMVAPPETNDSFQFEKKLREAIEKEVHYIEEEKIYYISYGVDEPPVNFIIRYQSDNKEKVIQYTLEKLYTIYISYSKGYRIMKNLLSIDKEEQEE